MNQDTGQKSAIYPQDKTTPILSQEEILKAEIAEKDRRAAAVFWWILMAMRAVIPLYVIYAIYLYWTLPTSAYLSGGY
ncbi:hypothetical protein QEV83_00580 [Methylocapsa sp. D3K7]|uniref:hypothetical protein n=1 Tax=Methylocapsa sp. D3K7 TaxID=3041435 RepID=UPI00244ECDDF|nr:hypothetical protein [Methylocapsa sp. D3K7]WGJ14853.1 hypothetical protein QEV83_00580 [Methylocapsa sp. D3K7]